MKHAKRIAAIAAGAGALALAAAAVFLIWKPEPAGIVAGVSQLPDSLNPVLEQNTAALDADELLFDGLVNFEVDPQGGRLYPEFALADSIDQDPATKSSYTVTLKEAAWHDGSPVTAKDVEYSFRAYVDPANASPKADYLSSFISAVTAVDARTVKVDFRRPIPPFRAYPVLTFKIIPSSYRGKALSTDMRSGENERHFAIEPVGTGPFSLKGWEIGSWLSFAANASYFKKAPGARTLVMKKVIDPVIRMNELRRGRVNLILDTSPLDRGKAEKIPGTDINWYLPYSFYQVSINVRSPLFANVDARRALSLAVDRSSLVPSVTDRKDGVVLNAAAFPADIFSRNIPEYGCGVLGAPLPRDVTAAKELAASGGIAGKSAILLYPDSLGDFGERMARNLAEQLSQTGLRVEPKRTGDQVYKRLVFAEKSYDLALVYCDGFDNLFSGLGDWYRSSGKSNISGIGDGELDRLFDAWDRDVVTADWVADTVRIAQRIDELCPSVNLFTLEKDVYSRGIKDVSIATDNPFLSAEDWTLSG